jgi:hypothetical protein
MMSATVRGAPVPADKADHVFLPGSAREHPRNTHDALRIRGGREGNRTRPD